ncbi:hypothetical protein PVL29_017235 [Vitis rotundifolia]|uniref:Uncharacterized protein n=1 Tax=Vitis rotundifolia TaxID=103349 RepID=A0AA38ZAS7_VITRO|nr:hypothetical protein PVL29_017235 [Vitis rotundifolia]
MHGGGGFDEKSHVCLHLGLTDYGTFVGTNLNPLWERFLVPFEDDSIWCQHTSSPLGNGAIIETSAKRIVVLRWSNNVGKLLGHFVFLGGHLEPQEIKISNNNQRVIIWGTTSLITKRSICSNIVSHQFDKDMDPDFINRKVSQEMFGSIIRVSYRVLNVRPAAFFFIKCNLHSKEIQQVYSTDTTSKMPGCHQGGFALYMLMVEAVKDV